MKKKNQNENNKSVSPKPFDHPIGIPYAGFPLPGTDYVSIDDKIKFIKRARPKDDMYLESAIKSYRMVLEKKGLNAAIVAFWEEVHKMPFSDQEINILRCAYAGDLQAVQLLVKTNASVLELPFVTKAMIKLIREYKYSHKKRLKEDIQKDWLNFLPLEYRNKNQIPFNEIDIKRFLNDEVKHNKKDPPAKIAKAFGIGKSTLRVIAPAKKGPGTFKKQS
jgi:hypothetical protein